MIFLLDEHCFARLFRRAPYFCRENTTRICSSVCYGLFELSALPENTFLTTIDSPASTRPNLLYIKPARSLWSTFILDCNAMSYHGDFVTGPRWRKVIWPRVIVYPGWIPGWNMILRLWIPYYVRTLIMIILSQTKRLAPQRRSTAVLCFSSLARPWRFDGPSTDYPVHSSLTERKLGQASAVSAYSK